MSTYRVISVECPICGQCNKFSTLTSTTIFGTSDFDSRPGGLYRRTMMAWVNECEYCGYASYDFEEKPKIGMDYLKSKEYLSCDSLTFKSSTARKFYRAGLINEKTGKGFNAYTDFLHAAWACDDSIERRNAEVCRKRAASLFEQYVRPALSENPYLLIVQADILRRIREFDKSICLLNEVSPQSDYRDIVECEVEFCKKEDSWCHNLAEVPTTEETDI